MHKRTELFNKIMHYISVTEDFVKTHMAHDHFGEPRVGRLEEEDKVRLSTINAYGVECCGPRWR
jgi:hypothetical protein